MFFFFFFFLSIQAFENSLDLRASLSKSKRKFACNARFLFCKDGEICAKNSPKRISHGVACAIVKLNSLRSPSPIIAPDFNK